MSIDLIKGFIMASACPLAFRTIDGTIARLNALSITLLLIVYALTFNVLFLSLLAVDFIIRIYGVKKYSPIYQISIGLKKLFNQDSMMVDAGAKRLAAQLGLVFTGLLLITHFLGLTLLTHIIISLFLLCTGLEFFFAFCVGCEIYFLIQKFR